jgi:hypothetical protein
MSKSKSKKVVDPRNDRRGTAPRQYRLGADSLAHIAAIVTHLDARRVEAGIPGRTSATDAIRSALERFAAEISAAKKP